MRVECAASAAGGMHGSAHRSVVIPGRNLQKRLYGRRASRA